MAAKKWHSGPPPSVGWWPASRWRDSSRLRWWDGFTWSEAAWVGSSELQAAIYASRPAASHPFDGIEWQHRPASWPARSKT